MCHWGHYKQKSMWFLRKSMKVQVSSLQYFMLTHTYGQTYGHQASGVKQSESKDDWMAEETLFWLSQRICSLGSSSVSWQRRGENSRVLFVPSISEVGTSTNNCSIWLNTRGMNTPEFPKLPVSPSSCVAYEAWKFPLDLTISWLVFLSFDEYQ